MVLYFQVIFVRLLFVVEPQKTGNLTEHMPYFVLYVVMLFEIPIYGLVLLAAVAVLLLMVIIWLATAVDRCGVCGYARLINGTIHNADNLV